MTLQGVLSSSSLYYVHTYSTVLQGELLADTGVSEGESKQSLLAKCFNECQKVTQSVSNKGLWCTQPKALPPFLSCLLKIVPFANAEGHSSPSCDNGKPSVMSLETPRKVFALPQAALNKQEETAEEEGEWSAMGSAKRRPC